MSTLLRKLASENRVRHTISFHTMSVACLYESCASQPDSPHHASQKQTTNQGRICITAQGSAQDRHMVRAHVRPLCVSEGAQKRQRRTCGCCRLAVSRRCCTVRCNRTHYSGSADAQAPARPMGMPSCASFCAAHQAHEDEPPCCAPD